MRTRRNSALVLGTLMMLVPASAHADRAATAREDAALQKAALAHCAAETTMCEAKGRGRISTRDRRYALAPVTGDIYDTSILRRSSASSLDFRALRQYGTGVADCKDLWKSAPRLVINDLRLGGLIGPVSFPRCPSRALKARRCESISVFSEGVRAQARVRARGISCKSARRIASQSARTGRVKSWNCLGSGEGSRCVRTRHEAALTAPRGSSAFPYIANVSTSLRSN